MSSAAGVLKCTFMGIKEFMTLYPTQGRDPARPPTRHVVSTNGILDTQHPIPLHPSF